MMYVKTLGLAATAAAALLALVGTSSASATVLCATTPTRGNSTTDATTCPEGWAYTAGVTVHAVNIGVITHHTPFKTIECKKSTAEGNTDNEGSATETVTGAVKVLTFEECNCEVKVLKTGTLEVHWIPDTFNGTLTANGQEVTVTCSTIFGNVHCIYVTNNKDIGEVTGSATHTSGAIFHANVSIERGPTNGLCSEESTWTATYEVTSPKPLWFADHT